MVLGDVGRSPRMQYHTVSLCTVPDTEVILIGYRGSQLIEDLQQPSADGRLTVRYIPDLPRWASKLPGLLRLVFKALFQLVTLLSLLLFSLPPPDVILLQLPPALPTMAVCRLAAARHRARLVFDWHNFAYTLMAINLGRRHPLEKHALLRKLRPLLATPMHPRDFAATAAEAAAAASSAGGAERTLCTERVRGGGSVRPRGDAPGLVVSSTSWTPDEDFGVLLAAAEMYDAEARRSRRPFPPLLFLVTGRGPQRAAYEERMRRMDLRHVAFRTVWLDPGDYPLLLGAADLGVSLHASSSGLDLPMKVVDMFGCGLPVCALSYPCIHELVQDQGNGLLFSTPQQLAQQLVDLFAPLPLAAKARGRLSALPLHLISYR